MGVNCDCEPFGPVHSRSSGDFWQSLHCWALGSGGEPKWHSEYCKQLMALGFQTAGRVVFPPFLRRLSAAPNTWALMRTFAPADEDLRWLKMRVDAKVPYAWDDHNPKVE